MISNKALKIAACVILPGGIIAGAFWIASWWFKTSTKIEVAHAFDLPEHLDRTGVCIPENTKKDQGRRRKSNSVIRQALSKSDPTARRKVKAISWKSKLGS